MYLPVLLYDMYGWSAVIAFAVPNVIGVMLFGRIVRRVSQSMAMIRRHQAAMTWFSGITVAFHVYFLAWVWHAECGANWLVSMFVPIPLFIAAMAVRGLSDRTFRQIAIVVYGLSLVLGLSLGLNMLDNGVAVPRERVWPAFESWGIVFLAPVMTMGFAICPYFDLTFHRAYHGAGGGENGRRIFTIFGIMFALMIGITALYAISGISLGIGQHIAMQAWFTMAIHLREVDRWSSEPRNEQPHAPLRSIVLLAALLLAPLQIVDYRHWMVFYALMFPALGLVTWVRRYFKKPELGYLAFTVAVLISAPCYQAGFFVVGWEWVMLFPVIGFLLASGLGQTTSSDEIHDEAHDENELPDADTPPRAEEPAT